METVDEELVALELQLPNLPHESVPLGPDEDSNREERRVGDLPAFDFPV